MQHSRRLELMIDLSNALHNARGFAARETRECWEQAARLAREIGDTGRLVQAVVDGAPVKFAAGEFKALRQALKSFDGESGHMNPGTRASYLLACGIAQFHLGLFDQADEAFDAALVMASTLPVEVRQMAGGVDVEIPCRAYLARLLSYRGEFSSAVPVAAAGRDYARRLGNMPALCWALQTTARLSVLSGESDRALAALREYGRIARECGLSTRVANAQMHDGEALLQSGDPSGAVPLLRQGLHGWRQAGGLFHCSEYAAEIAGLLVTAGQTDAALEFLEAGESFEGETDERFCHAEILRILGKLLNLGGQPEQARARYEEATGAALEQGALLFALRALCDLNDPDAGCVRGHPSAARLRALLAKIYDGCDCTDFRRARALAREG